MKIKICGFAPKVKLEDGMRDLAEWGERVEAVDRVAEADSELEKRRLKV
jgi:hypothetical protein